MPLSWVPNFDFSGLNFQGLGDTDEVVFVVTADADTTNVLFVLTPDSCSLTVDLFTEQVRHVFPNSGPVGDVRFSVWTYPGPNGDVEPLIVVDDGGSGVFDDHGSWSFIYGQIPVPNAAVVVDQDVEGLGSVTVAATSGPVLGCVASLDGTTDPSITYPGDSASQGVNYAHAGDSTTSGDLCGFASDLPGDFDISSALMRRVVLLGAAAAGRWTLGKVGWGS